MKQEKTTTTDIRDAACIAFGLLAARATSNADRQQNRDMATRIIRDAILANQPEKEPSRQKNGQEYGTVGVMLDGAIDSRCGYLTIDIDEVMESLLDQAKDRDNLAGDEPDEDCVFVHDAECLRRAAMLIRRAY